MVEMEEILFYKWCLITSYCDLWLNTILKILLDDNLSDLYSIYGKSKDAEQTTCYVIWNKQNKQNFWKQKNIYIEKLQDTYGGINNMWLGEISRRKNSKAGKQVFWLTQSKKVKNK